MLPTLEITGWACPRKKRGRVFGSQSSFCPRALSGTRLQNSGLIPPQPLTQDYFQNVHLHKLLNNFLPVHLHANMTTNAS